MYLKENFVMCAECKYRFQFRFLCLPLVYYILWFMFSQIVGQRGRSWKGLH